MARSVRRILIIFVISSIWITLAVLGLRKMGLSDQFPGFEHPLLNNQFWLIAWDPSMSAKQLKAFAELHPQIILGAAVQSLKDGELVLGEKHYIFKDGQTQFLRGMSLQTWRSLHPEAMTLNEFIQQFSDRALYLNLDRLNVLNNAWLNKSLEPLKDSRMILIKSSPQSIKRSLKEKHPMWLFSNTTAEMGKLKIMHALFLETIASLNADFFVDKSYSPRVLNEVQRRNKKAIYIHNADEAEPLIKAKKFDGIVTAQPSEFISLVD